ncbi:MAG: IF-2-associated domain-containing protein, partial [Caulobacteraceae bacterium]|nr:IF-2-associated domain-containing protein [Caulobacteraceae bacterium]
MTDENDNGRQSLPPVSRAPLTLKARTGGAVSAGMVKQSFSHGRSKTVVVETKRRRLDAPGAGPTAPLSAERRAVFDVRGPTPPRPPRAPEAAPAGGLSEDERRARQ